MDEVNEPNYGINRLYDPQEVADILRVSRRTIYNLAKSGKLQGVRVGHSWRFSRACIERITRPDVEVQALPVQA